LCNGRLRNVRCPSATTWCGMCGPLGGLTRGPGRRAERSVSVGRGRRGGRRLLGLRGAGYAIGRGLCEVSAGLVGRSPCWRCIQFFKTTVSGRGHGGGKAVVVTGRASAVVTGVWDDTDVVRQGAVCKFLLSSPGLLPGLGCMVIWVRSLPLLGVGPVRRAGRSSSVRALGTVSSRSANNSACLYISGSESMADRRCNPCRRLPSGRSAIRVGWSACGGSAAVRVDRSDPRSL
jgi:hypothetical protein